MGVSPTEPPGRPEENQILYEHVWYHLLTCVKGACHKHTFILGRPLGASRAWLFSTWATAVTASSSEMQNPNREVIPAGMEWPVHLTGGLHGAQRPDNVEGPHCGRPRAGAPCDHASQTGPRSLLPVTPTPSDGSLR